MDRRTFLKGTAAISLLHCRRTSGQVDENSTFVESYFPSAAHKFVWRNWDLVPAERIAAALQCKVEAVRKLAATLGLGPKQVANKHESRTWFKVLRRNWEFVPFDQLTVLLGKPEDEIREMMIPYNFVNNHLGPKPKCPHIRLHNSMSSSSDVIPHFRFPAEEEAGEERFAFLENLHDPIAEPPWLKAKGEVTLAPRMLFPYCALYGDVLSSPDFESCYPPGVLDNIARMGLDSIWLHGVLRDLVPSKIFPEFGKGGEQRLRRLNALVRAARQRGLAVYLFLNEPRGMPEAFFDKYPGIKGAPGRPTDALTSMCTSTHMVKQFLVEATETLLRLAPDLQGVILITASEAPTNCYSIHRRTPCPRCARRSGPEVIGEVVRLIEQGVRQSKPGAHVIVWDWSWGIVEDDPQKEVIDHLPGTVTLMVDFERGSSIERKGVKSTVDEYSLSTVGPSPRAAAHIAHARARHMQVMAKVQVGNTWESGLVPYIPVPSLVARKFRAMLEAGISGAMESWTLGTYPSPNWEVARAFYHEPVPETKAVLREVAIGIYGEKAAPKVLESWSIFAKAFEQYPFSIQVVYSSIVQCGPAHPIYFKPSGQIPRIMKDYDSLHWTQPFGPQVVADVFGEMAKNWRRGLDQLDEALKNVPAAKKRQAARDADIARVMHLYFKSISNQVHFLILRSQWKKQHALLARMSNVVREEADLAGQLYAIVRRDSRIGFEPAMQYFYLPHDIRERIVSCRYMLDKQIPDAKRRVALTTAY